jgi:hypothetical protein
MQLLADVPFIASSITSKYSGRNVRTSLFLRSEQRACASFLRAEETLKLFMSLIPCTFLQSLYFPTNALHDTIYLTHIKTPTCFGTRVPFSGIDYKESAWANVLINVLFTVMGLLETFVFKILKCTKYIKLIMLIIYSVLIIS